MKDEFEEISRMLAIFENPLRRKILHRLVSDACYPLQLSKELRVSQQAIMKHLEVLEKCGIVRCRSEKSENAGPPRKSYYPIRRVSMVLDFGPHLYDVKVYVDDRLPLPDKTEDNVGKGERNSYIDSDELHLKRISQRKADPERFRKVIKSIIEMNKEIERLDSWRLSMVRQKEALLREAYTLAKDLTSSILEMKVLSLAIERGLADINDNVISMIADELDVREKEVEEILNKYKELIIQDYKEYKETRDDEKNDDVKISNEQRRQKNKR
ncbi:MAG: helix-turn-helix domain-containing protein [Thermoplasmata archaeon]